MYANLALASVLNKQSALDQARRYTRHLQTVCADLFQCFVNALSSLLHDCSRAQHACKAPPTSVAQVPATVIYSAAVWQPLLASCCMPAHIMDFSIIHGRLKPAMQACATTRPCRLHGPAVTISRHTRLGIPASPALAAPDPSTTLMILRMVQASQKAHQNFGPAFAYRIAATFQSLGYALEDPQQGLRKCKLLRAGLNIASASLATWQLMRRCSTPARCLVGRNLGDGSAG